MGNTTSATVADDVQPFGGVSMSAVGFQDMMEIDENIHNVLEELEKRMNSLKGVSSVNFKPGRLHTVKPTKTSDKGDLLSQLGQGCGGGIRASLTSESSDLSADSDWSEGIDIDLTSTRFGARYPPPPLPTASGTAQQRVRTPSPPSVPTGYGDARPRVPTPPPPPPAQTAAGTARPRVRKHSPPPSVPAHGAALPRIPTPPPPPPLPSNNRRFKTTGGGVKKLNSGSGIGSVGPQDPSGLSFGRKAPEVDIVHSPVKNPGMFFQLLLTAIKTNQISAVDAMCESAKADNIHLDDTTKFSEKMYTATALHAALLFNRAEIARKLILACPGLVRIPYTSSLMYGQTCLHIASANNDVGTMDMMLSYLGDYDRRNFVDYRATGTYFKERHPAGALCLTAAIWAGHVDALECLLRYGATMNIAGPSGNTPLHQVVIFSHDHPKQQDRAQLMFEVFWKYCDSTTGVVKSSQRGLRKQIESMRRLLGIRNDDGQTPFTLAVNLQAPIAKYLLNFENLYRQPETKFCSAAFVTYDVTDVTSYGCMEGSWTRYNPRSVLHILAHRAKIVSSDEETFDLIEAQPISDLVKMKWNVYRWIYYLWCVIHLAYMITLTWYATQLATWPKSTLNGTYKRGPDATHFTSNLTEPVKGNTGNELSYHWIFSLLPIIYIVFEVEEAVVSGFFFMTSLVSSKGYVRTVAHLAGQWTVTGNGPYRVLLVLFSVSVLGWTVLFAVQSIDQDVALSLALMFGWIFMVFFTRGLKATSRFSIMVQKMFFHDLIYFLSVYWFIWIAFSAAMLAIGRHDERNNISVGDTLFHMLNVVTDAGEKATEESARIPTVAAVLLSCYAVISVVLLLNMLIAMMNASYDAVSMSKTNLFRYQQLSILLMIERRLFWWRWLCERSQFGLWRRARTMTPAKKIPMVYGVDIEMVERPQSPEKDEDVCVSNQNRVYADVTLCVSEDCY